MRAATYRSTDDKRIQTSLAIILILFTKHRVTHLFDVLSVRGRNHLWGEVLRRFLAFRQLLID